MLVTNQIDQTYKTYGGRARTRARGEPDLLAVHRLRPQIDGLDFEIRDAMTAARAFYEHEELHAAFPGGRVYHGIVPPEGGIYQWVPLRYFGSASYLCNRRTLDFAVLGDFRQHAPTAAQVRTMIEAARVLRGRFGLRVGGHSEFHDDPGLPAATSHEGKGVGEPYECPGPLYDLDELRSESDPGESFDALAAVGFTW